METLQQFFINNPVWTLLISVIIAIVIAVVSYRKGRKIKKPTYYVKSNNLFTDFSSKITKLKMLYGDTPIERLTASKVAFWNDGTETINKEDIVGSEPLRIEAVGSCDIVDASIIKEIDSVNKFRVEIVNKKEVKILFDFLDKGQGGAIQIMHTGKESSDIKVDGFVKGAGKPRPSYTRSKVLNVIDKIFPPVKQAQPTKPPPAKTRRDAAIFLLIAAVVTIIPSLSQKAVEAKVFGVVFFLIYLYFSYLMLKRRVPKGLEIVEEEES